MNEDAILAPRGLRALVDRRPLVVRDAFAESTDERLSARSEGASEAGFLELPITLAHASLLSRDLDLVQFGVRLGW